jgi:hypothetical protein
LDHQINQGYTSNLAPPQHAASSDHRRKFCWKWVASPDLKKQEVVTSRVVEVFQDMDGFKKNDEYHQSEHSR